MKRNPFPDLGHWHRSERLGSKLEKKKIALTDSMPPRHKNAFVLGLEKVLNNPNASFLTNPATFREINSKSGMSITQMMKHVGKKRGNESKPPTDKQKSEERLNNLKINSEK